MSGNKELNDDLLRELECPVCNEYMEPPVVLCMNGHSICKNCRPRLQQCPTCRSHISDVRNIALENIARFSLYPCKNRDSGCKLVFNLASRSKHESECFYKKYPCPFAKFCKETCPWKGFIIEITDHIRTSHTGPNDHCTATGAFEVHFMEFNRSGGYDGAITFNDETFFLLCKMTRGLLLVTLVYLGPKEMSLEYKYEVTLYSQDGVEMASFCQRVQDYFVDAEQVLSPEKCMVFHESTLKRFLDSAGDLKSKMQIFNATSPIFSSLKDEASGGEEMVVFLPGRKLQKNSVAWSPPNTQFMDRFRNRPQSLRRPVVYQPADVPNDNWQDIIQFD